MLLVAREVQADISLLSSATGAVTPIVTACQISFSAHACSCIFSNVRIKPIFCDGTTLRRDQVGRLDAVLHVCLRTDLGSADPEQGCVRRAKNWVYRGAWSRHLGLCLSINKNNKFPKTR